MSAVEARDPEEVFQAAYQRCLDHWPVPVESRVLPTRFGDTHLLLSGPSHASTVLLLPGGGATALAWSAIAGALAADHRVVALDPLGQPGRSRRTGSIPKTTTDLMVWLDQVVDSLTADHIRLVGHSYGAWMALRYALTQPERIRRLALVDPTDCFTSLRLAYRVRALPQALRPSPAGVRRLLDWETAGRTLNPEWLSVVTAGAALGPLKIVMPRRPSARDLAALRPRTLTLVALRSRAQNPDVLRAQARRMLPSAKIADLPSASHHTLPMEDAAETLAVLEPFLKT